MRTDYARGDQRRRGDVAPGSDGDGDDRPPSGCSACGCSRAGWRAAWGRARIWWDIVLVRSRAGGRPTGGRGWRRCCGADLSRANHRA